MPFTHPKTGEPFHARDAFDATALGFAYDELPAARPPQLREPPYFAHFGEVDIVKVRYPRLLHVFVADQAHVWMPPTISCLGRWLRQDLTTLPGRALRPTPRLVPALPLARDCSAGVPQPRAPWRACVRADVASPRTGDAGCGFHVDPSSDPPPL